MQHITRKELERFQVMVPDTKIDQQQIAGFLSLVDRAIQRTEALINKYERVDRGQLSVLVAAYGRFGWQ